MATEIGDSFKAGDINNAVRYMAHAATGCIIGSVTGDINDSGSTGDNCASGLGGAVVGEFIADTYKSNAEHAEGVAAVADWLKERGIISEEEFNSLSDIERLELQNKISDTGMSEQEYADFRQHGIDFAKVGAALTAFVAGANVEIAAATAENAAANNALHIPAWLIYLWWASTATVTVFEIAGTVEDVANLYVELEGADTEEQKREIILAYAKAIGIDITVGVITAATGTKLLKIVADMAKGSGKVSDEVYDELIRLDNAVDSGETYTTHVNKPEVSDDSFGYIPGAGDTNYVLRNLDEMPSSLANPGDIREEILENVKSGKRDGFSLATASVEVNGETHHYISTSGTSWKEDAPNEVILNGQTYTVVRGDSRRCSICT